MMTFCEECHEMVEYTTEIVKMEKEIKNKSNLEKEKKLLNKNFINIKFFISWWAFTFPMAAITLATILMYELTNYWFYSFLGYFLMTVTTIVVLLVARQTIIHMKKKEICIMESNLIYIFSKIVIMNFIKNMKEILWILDI